MFMYVCVFACLFKLYISKSQKLCICINYCNYNLKMVLYMTAWL